MQTAQRRPPLKNEISNFINEILYQIRINLVAFFVPRIAITIISHTMDGLN